MLVCDHERYLKQSIDSILNQTFTDFQFIIISEHGSSVESIQAIKTFADPRIIHIHNARRMGLVRSRNAALENARGEYIALMDADDVSAPERLQKQVEFLEAHSDVGIVGSALASIDKEDQVLTEHVSPSGGALTRWRLFFGNPVANPTVMMRRAVCQQLGGYTTESRYDYGAEDYELWLRAAKMTKIVNLKDILLRYRRHEGNLTRIHEHEMLENTMVLVQKTLASELDQNVGLNIVRALVWPNIVSKAIDALDAGRVIYALCLRCIHDPAFMEEETAIRLDATDRLSLLALAALKTNPLFAAKISCLIARLYQKHMRYTAAYAQRCLRFCVTRIIG
jgi:hypothetical protein